MTKTSTTPGVLGLAPDADPIVINLFAGPCSGKTTLALDLGAALKKLGVRVELIGDLPREDVYEEAWKRLDDGLFQLARLNNRLRMLQGNGIEVVIMESPILMRVAYLSGDTSGVLEAMRALIVQLHHRQNSLNIHLQRNPAIPYDAAGRDVGEAEALERSRIVAGVVDRHADPKTLMRLMGGPGSDATARVLERLGVLERSHVVAGAQRTLPEDHGSALPIGTDRPETTASAEAATNPVR